MDDLTFVLFEENKVSVNKIVQEIQVLIDNINENVALINSLRLSDVNSDNEEVEI